MPGKFLVLGSFHVRSRTSFVFFGDFLEGSTEPGAGVRLSLGDIRITTAVNTLEVIEVTMDARRYHGLALGYESPEELETWSELSLANIEIQFD